MFQGFLNASGEVLVKLLGQPLPPEAMPSTQYLGPPRVIVPTVRTTVSRDESLSIKAIVLSAQPPKSVTIYLARINSEQVGK